MLRRLTLILFSVTIFGLDIQAVDFPATTQPHKDVELRFLQPGAVRAIPVSTGQNVETGDVLVQLDDDAEQARLAIAKIEASNQLPLRIAILAHQQRQSEYERLQQAFSHNAIPAIEVDRARLQASVAELEAEQAQVTAKLQQQNVRLAEVATRNMCLKAPFAGTIERIDAEVGAYLSPNEVVLRLIDTRQLAIESAIPLDIAEKINLGDEAIITFQDTSTAIAEVIWLAADAEAASQTRRLRLLMTNTTARPAGERVRVTHPATQSTSSETTRSTE